MPLIIARKDEAAGRGRRQQFADIGIDFAMVPHVEADVSLLSTRPGGAIYDMKGLSLFHAGNAGTIRDNAHFG